MTIEQQVRHFPRYHKYTIGTDLRKSAMALMKAVHRATYQPTLDNVAQLVESIEIFLAMFCTKGYLRNGKRRRMVQQWYIHASHFDDIAKPVKLTGIKL